MADSDGVHPRRFWPARNVSPAHLKSRSIGIPRVTYAVDITLHRVIKLARKPREPITPRDA